MDINKCKIKRPIAVVGRGDGLTADLLRKIQPHPVVALTPCEAAMAGKGTGRYRAVVVENFDPVPSGLLTPCGAARWVLAGQSDLTVVALDNEEGRRLAEESGLSVYAYSDGKPQADLTAKYVRLFDDRMEFEALTDGELLRVRVPLTHGPRLYEYLAALAGAAALGVPLSQAASKLAG